MLGSRNSAARWLLSVLGAWAAIVSPCPADAAPRPAPADAAPQSPSATLTLNLPTTSVSHASSTRPRRDLWYQLIALPEGTSRTYAPAGEPELVVHVRRSFMRAVERADSRVWLNLRASRLGLPGARSASVHLKRRLYEGRLHLGVESWDQVVEPFRAEMAERRRVVRRVGPAISYDYHEQRRSAWRRLRPGTCVHLGGKLWPHRISHGQGADTRLELSALRAPGRRGGLRAWGRARLRALWGAEDDHLELGGWQPELGNRGPRSAQPLAEPMLGYEDVQRHGHRLAQAQGGLGYVFASRTGIELFGAASRIGSTSATWDEQAQDDALLRAVGVAVATTVHIGDVPLTLAYQLAHRFDRRDGRQLHLVSLVL